MKMNRILLLLVLSACGTEPRPSPDEACTTCSDAGDPIQPATAELTGQETRERVVADQVYPINVRLDATTVLCSHADYSASFLKVLIPQIANVTVFDHRNVGAGASCIAAGECSDGLGVETLLQGCDSCDEAIDLRVVLTALYSIDHDTEVCQVSLQERLSTTIRGVEFRHARDGFISERAYADCLGVAR